MKNIKQELDGLVEECMTISEEYSRLKNGIKNLTDLEPEEFLKQLAKYGLAKEPEKVEVPKFVAEFFEKIKNDLDWAIHYLSNHANKGCECNRHSPDLIRWFVNPSNKPIETLVRMKDGYTVKEPRYVIKSLEEDISDDYLLSLEYRSNNGTYRDYTEDIDKAFKFVMKEEAEKVAVLVGGYVEVEE